MFKFAVVSYKMLIKSWVKGPWWDADGVKHDGPVEGKLLPTDNPKHLGLIGIVDCVQGASVNQGFTTRGVPLYICHPLRPDYPPFLVAVKETYSAPPIVSMNLEHWDGKWPRGGIQRVLGMVGDANAERDAVIRSVQFPRTHEMQDCVFNNEGYDSSPWDMVLNIDPAGCRDVDDILCWRHLDNGSVEFAIAIADVSAFIPEGSILDKEARVRCSTLYDDGVAVDPMFPTYVSHGCASLLADGTERPALALIYTLFSGRVMSCRWEQIVCPVMTAYTYSTVLKSDHVAFLRDTISAVVGHDVGPDSHVWIEAVMVQYNTAAAVTLKGKKVGLLRIHEGTQLAEWVELSKRTSCKELAWFGSSGGAYVDGATTGATRHAGLDKTVYCHASSPLRRYADLVNQRWLKHILFGSVKPMDTVSADLINSRCLTLKSCERLLWFLHHIDVGAITTVTGIVIESGVNGVKVYCPEVRRCFRIRGGEEKNLVVSQTVTPSPRGARRGLEPLLSPTERVTCRIFCDRSRCNLNDRYVVQVA